MTWRNNSESIRRRSIPGLRIKSGAAPSGTPGTGAITVTAPTSYRVFQRGVSGQGTITISGTYTGTPGAMEASFNNGAWTRLSDTPTDNIFSGSIANQSAGQGTLSVRWIGNSGSAVNVTLVGMGDVIIIGGQSNAVGMTAANQSYSHATLKACKWANDYTWKELVDPVDDPTGQVDTVSQDSPPGGSAWPLMATTYLASQGIPIAFVPCAKQDTGSAAWVPGANHQDRTTLFGSMEYRTLQAGGARCMVWWQGESDCVNAVNLDTFEANVNNIVTTYYNDTGVKVMICRLEDMAEVYQGFDEAPYNTRLTNVINTNAGALAGPSGLDFNDLHYSSAQAATVAAAWWVAMQTAFGWS